MFCNKITIPEFTPKQIAECKQCRHISGKKIWCCLFGAYVDRPRIITPSRKIIRPFPKSNKGFDKDRFKRNYAVAVEMAKGSGKVIVDEGTFIKRRQGCVICPPEDKSGCDCAGCKQWHKLILKELKCPKGKWAIEQLKLGFIPGEHTEE